jgi:protein phosphatase
VAREHLGGLVRCPSCNAPFGVRAAPTPPPAPPPFPPVTGPLRLEIGSATSKGRVRERNEDSLLVQHLVWTNLDDRHELALLVVADGMGGYSGGELASGLVVRTVGVVLTPLLASAMSGQMGGPAALSSDTLDFALREANTIVYNQAQTDPAYRGMGATAAAALIWNAQVLISHVGDARVYHHHAGKLLQVTRDQTLVGRMVELGQLSEAEALTHPLRNEVTQAVGKHTKLELARSRLQLSRGDWLLVVCDGLYTHVDAQAAEQQIARAAPSAAHVAHALVELANQGGGTDNCTVIAVRGV